MFKQSPSLPPHQQVLTEQAQQGAAAAAKRHGLGSPLPPPPLPRKVPLETDYDEDDGPTTANWHPRVGDNSDASTGRRNEGDSGHGLSRTPTIDGIVYQELDSNPIYQLAADEPDPSRSDGEDHPAPPQHRKSPRKRRTLDPEEQNVFRSKIMQYLVYAQKTYPSRRYRTNLDDGTAYNEDDLVDSLKDLIEEHARVRYENHFMRNTPSGKKFESDKIIKDLELQIEKLQRKAVRDAENAENAALSLKGKYQRDTEKLKDDIKELKNKTENSKYKLSIAVSNAERKLNLAHNRLLGERDAEIQALRRQVAQLGDEMDQTRTNHRDEVERAKKEVSDFEINRAKNHFKPKVTALEAQVKELESDRDMIEERLNTEFKFKEKSYMFKIQNMEETHEEEMHKLEYQFKDDIRAAERETEELRNRHKEELESINSKLEALRVAHAIEINELNSKHEEKLKEKDRTGQAALAKERRARDMAIKAKEKENQSLKRGLVNRDNELDKFKPLTDRELSDRFLELAREIDDAARVQWDTSEKSWPVPERQIRKSENERRTRQRILQNTIWAILYDKVFETPFRVLGPAGKPLESMWTKEFSHGEYLYVLGQLN
jgi:hypothetical protein